MFAFSFFPDFVDKEKAESLQKSITNNLPLQVYTSGSTGKPKSITFPMEVLKASAKMTNDHFQLDVNTQALLCLSLDTVAGKMMAVRAHEGNYRLFLAQPRSRPLENCVTKIDFIAMVPSQLQESLKFDTEKLKQIRVILIGGGPISEELEAQLHANQLIVHHSYGMTETASHIALRKVGVDTEKDFHVLPGVSIHEKNSQLVIDAPHLQISNLLTNDIVELTSPTSFRWLGRKDFVVNSGGYKIHIETLEEKLSTSISFPFFLWKMPDEKWGEVLVFCHAEKDVTNLNFDSLNLKAHETPKKIIRLPQLMYSESGKLLRQASFDQVAI